jgi:hypothetical protein
MGMKHWIDALAIILFLVMAYAAVKDFISFIKSYLEHRDDSDSRGD